MRTVQHPAALAAQLGCVYKSAALHYDRRRVRTIDRYILREILVPFGLGLGVFTLILLIARILKLIELVVNRGVPIIDVLRVFSYILPAFLEVTIPMALLLAVLVAFGRLSSDSEITALQTSGVSLWQMLRPVALFALAVFAVALGVSWYGRAWGNGLLRTGLYEIAKTGATAAMRERVFADDFPGLVIYVDRMGPGGNSLRGVLIADTREKGQRNTILAQSGTLVPNENQHTLTLRLAHGSVHSFDNHDRSYHRTDFNTYDINLDLNAALARLRPRERDPSEIPSAELRRLIAEKEATGTSATAEVVEIQRRLSIPFACLGFAAIAVPLGIQPSRAVRSRGFILSIVLIFIYYVFLSLGENLGNRGILPAVVALWIPNAFLVLLALGAFTVVSHGGLGNLRGRLLFHWRANRRRPAVATAGPGRP
ncbi:LPS export ABC transporter permease LptF [Candidatus Binatia bacterium]|nr:LPS export ABC transporter permease LptF [Candidatus Binatia bacterium]